MLKTKNKDKFLTTRVTHKSHTAFHRKAGKFGKPSDVLRELISAFIEDRIVIQPPVTPKDNLYVTRNQN